MKGTAVGASTTVKQIAEAIASQSPMAKKATTKKAAAGAAPKRKSTKPASKTGGKEAKATPKAAKQAGSATPRRSARTPRGTALKDPQGGLTAAGREYFREKEGAHLRPGVQGPADTPEKELRKGSFLRRHFAHPRGPMERDGQPTRLALSAQAWGEKLPKTKADAKRLADKGHVLLERYHRDKEKGAETATKKKGSGDRSTPRRSPVTAKGAHENNG